MRKDDVVVSSKVPRSARSALERIARAEGLSVCAYVRRLILSDLRSRGEVGDREGRQ